MRSLFEKKPWVVLLAILALGAISVLASGLRNIPFHSAQPLMPSLTVRETFNARALIAAWQEIPISSQVGAWLLIIVIAVLIGVLLSPESRKRLLRIIFRTVVTYWLLYYLFKEYGDRLSGAAFGLLSPKSPSLTPGSGENPPVFTPTKSMVWISYGISFLIVLAVVIITWRAYLFWMKYRVQSSDNSLNKIALIARTSLRDLSSGRDSTNVIMNCYYRMSDVVADKRDLQREIFMTPAEFAVRLEQAGLPGDSVRRLTRLFEAVRYGDHRSDHKEVNEAVACLNTILKYCGETA